MDLVQLKSGSDVRGVAMEGVPGEGVTLTDDAVRHIVTAFADWLAVQTGQPTESLKIAVGRDSRLSGPRIQAAVTDELVRRGVSVSDCGLASTPAMFMTTVQPKPPYSGAVQITASHHPWHRNGLKFFGPHGGLEGAEIEAILTAAERPLPPAAAQPGVCTAIPFMEAYADGLRQKIAQSLGGERPLEGFHIVVDAGNGAGGFYATRVLEPLGADISGSQFLEPDGHFPNHIPNPENPQAMESVCRATVAAGADLGVIFDTDVDRAGLVDAQGRPINRNRLIALAAAMVLEQCPGGTVVTDSVTSDGLKPFIEQTLGGHHRRFKRGYRNVIDEAVRLCREGVDAPLAIETSGHAALRENYFLDDGAYLATCLIIQVAKLKQKGQTLADLIRALPEPAESAELRFAVTAPNVQATGQAILERLTALARQNGWAIAPDSEEGVRLSLEDGWMLLRLSVHDPVMPLNIESNTPGGCRRLARHIAAFVQAEPGIDCTQFTNWLEETP